MNGPVPHLVARESAVLGAPTSISSAFCGAKREENGREKGAR